MVDVSKPVIGFSFLKQLRILNNQSFKEYLKMAAITNGHWIQHAIKHHNRVISYMSNKYGKEAFDEKGNIKEGYLEKAESEATSKSLKDALNLAIKLKHGF